MKQIFKNKTFLTAMVTPFNDNAIKLNMNNGNEILYFLKIY